MEDKRPSRLVTVGKYASILVVILVLVGSLAVMLNYMQQRTSIAGVKETLPAPTATAQELRPTPTAPPPPTPTPIAGPPIGTTLYTTGANAFGSNGLAWSPDSKRVASSTVSGAQIWDAVDGQHLVTVQLSGSNEWPCGLDWSPNSQLIAIATNQEVVIANSQSGKVVRTHPANLTAMTKPISTSTSYLANRFPDSGGLGYRATAWSPNGQTMASALSLGASGEVQIWNPQTGMDRFTLKVGANYNVGSLSWSSDSQYLAATTWNTQAGDPTQPNSQVVVWKISTHQQIFQHSDLMNSDAPIVWQPQTHNIAFNGTVSSNGSSTLSLEVWNAMTGKLVKQYAQTANGGLSWSPDGRYLAYAGYVGKDGRNDIIIIEATTGKQIYIYKEHKNTVGYIAWSPNGKYIASGESNSGGAMLVKVWVAE